MNNGLPILFLICSIFPGFILFQCFKDAYAEYKHTGVFSFETLIGNPALFFLSLAAFVGMLVMSVVFLVNG